MTPQSDFTLTPAHQYTTFISITKYVINLTLTQQPAVVPLLPSLTTLKTSGNLSRFFNVFKG